MHLPPLHRLSGLLGLHSCFCACIVLPEVGDLPVSKRPLRWRTDQALLDAPGDERRAFLEDGFVAHVDGQGRGELLAEVALCRLVWLGHGSDSMVMYAPGADEKDLHDLMNAICESSRQTPMLVSASKTAFSRLSRSGFDVW